MCFAHRIDNNDDGSIEKGEFEQAKASGQNLNKTLIDILDKKFQGNAATQVTYERK
jgi:Ca2+-binding EF-hand superfamily protein